MIDYHSGCSGFMIEEMHSPSVELGRYFMIRRIKRFLVLAGAAMMCLNAVAAMASGIIADGASLEKLSGDYSFTEGPAVAANGDVYFTDQPNDRIVRWDAEKKILEDWMKPAGRSNGTFFDGSGNLIACADEKNELWSIAPDKSVTVILKDFEGRLLNGPNDVWVHPGGGMYFTDPLYPRPYWKRDPASELDGRHVYYVAPGSGRAVRVADGFNQPNGLVGTPDGKTLYVADINDRKTYKFNIESDGKLTGRQLFCEMGSDGMTLDDKGNVYLTGRGVTVFNPQGEQIEHIEVPERWTANVVFGGVDMDQLFITASRSVFTLKMSVRGAGFKKSEAEGVEVRPFGTARDGRKVSQFILKNRNGMEVRAMNIGATLTGILVPGRNGKNENVIVGSDDFSDYLGRFPSASVIGRFANRIRGATFEIDGDGYRVTANNGAHHIHGGKEGFAGKFWDGEIVNDRDGAPGVRFTYVSADGEEGYPGELKASVKYTLSDDNKLHIEYRATTSKPTIVNLTNHAYFNLTGRPGSSFADHTMWLDTDLYTEVDRSLIPTGAIVTVAGTPLDFREAKPLGRDAQDITHPRAGIYDHNYVLKSRPGNPVKAAVVYEPESGRRMSMWTDLPGVQLFTGNPRGFCLETQYFPDAVNHPHFPSPVIRPDEEFHSVTIFGFEW